MRNNNRKNCYHRIW